MANIYQLPTQTPATVGINPNLRFAIFGDDLTTVTTAGYMNQNDLESNPLSSNDIIQAFYDYDLQAQTGQFGIFTVSLGGSGSITLTSWANPGEVVLPVVDNHFAAFDGSGGQIADLGYLPSDSTKTRVVMASSSTTANAFAAFADTTGTVKNLVRASGTEVAGSVTANGSVGVITTSSLSGASPSPYTFTWSNSYITASSVIQLTLMGGTSPNSDVCFRAVPGAGSCSVTVVNTESSFGGTLLIGYTVF